MSLQTRLSDLITRLGTEFKAIRILIGGSGTSTVSGLNTTATNLVGAINEVKVTADAAGTSNLAIDDTGTSSSSVWSSSKTNTEITNAVNGVLDGAPAALDTLNELAAAIGDNANYAASITTALSLKANTADVYTKTEIGNPETDLVALFETAIA